MQGVRESWEHLCLNARRKRLDRARWYVSGKRSVARKCGEAKGQGEHRSRSDTAYGLLPPGSYKTAHVVQNGLSENRPARRGLACVLACHGPRASA